MRDTILLILGMAVVTYIPRLAPLWLLSSRKLPEAVIRWLELIPPAVLSALLIPALVLGKKDGTAFLDISTGNVFLLATIPAALTAYFTKSFLGTVAVGMGGVALLRFLGFGG